MENITPTEAVAIAGGAVAIVAHLVALLPQAKPGTVWAFARGVLDIIAANYGNAANAPK